MFTLAHLSDPHLGPLPPVRWRDLASKRAFGYMNWRGGRGASLGPASLKALIDDLRRAEPDHIAVTGDLINIGLPAEVDAARAWLAELGDEGDVTVVPGNHDAYLPGAVRHFTEAWSPYMTGDGGGPAGFPFVRVREPVALVGVSSAVATAPLMATGRIGAPQAEALAETLRALGRDQLFRVVLIHHSPLARSAPWHRRLIGAEHFRRAVGTAGAELVLHGHNHVTTVASLSGQDSTIPVVGATSASLHPHEGRPGGSYLLYRIDREKGEFVCEMEERGSKLPGGPVETLSVQRLHG
ncbi:MAG TPA: metallophosphoesterase [Bauldia sp.]|nr:metallophosphoesterase [Bauldia sp.]